MIEQNLMKNKWKIVILGLIMITPFLLFYVPQMDVNGYSAFVSSSSDMDTLKVSNLEAGITYNFSVSYSTTFGDSYDIGFAIYEKDSFKDKHKLLTQDDLGDGFESALFTPSIAGDYYIGVWMNGDNYGFVDVIVVEDGTTNEKSISSIIPNVFANLTWLWIFLGVMGGVLILISIGAALIISRVYKANKAKIAKALEQGIALPRAGRNKDKCPFCGVKLPDHYLSQCPYCNAPITDEE